LVSICIYIGSRGDSNRISLHFADRSRDLYMFEIVLEHYLPPEHYIPPAPIERPPIISKSGPILWLP
jgi:hypothetical protein